MRQRQMPVQGGVRARGACRLRRGFALVAAATVAAMLAHAPVAAACAPSWTMRALASTGHGLAGGSSLAGVSELSPADVWAVGHQLGPGETHETLVEHWGGRTWRLVPSPNVADRNNDLQAVAGVAPNDVWTVGSSLLAGLGLRPLAEHWDGRAWRIVPTPSPPAAQAPLLGITPPQHGDAWAVGEAVSATGGSRTLVEHWDGHAWRIVGSPNPSASENVLLDVAARAPGDVWAVGYRRTPAGYRNLVEHWDGRAWTLVAVPSPGRNEDVLAGVAAGGAGVWAVGYANDGGAERPVALHRTATGWAVTRPPAIGAAGTLLRAVSSPGGAEAVAVGATFDVALGRWRPLAERWAPGGWHVEPTRVPSLGGDSEALGVVAPPGAPAWAVGTFGRVAMVLARGCPVPARAFGPAAAQRAGTAAAQGGGHAAAPSGAGVVARDVAAPAGIAETTRDWSAAVTDLDRNGFPDIVLSRHQLAGRIELNHGGVFTEVHPGTLVGRDRHDCHALDANRDGRPDIFCSVGSDRGTALKSDQLLIQQPGGSFLDRAPQLGLLDPFGRGDRSAVLDANGDGRPDVFAGDRSRADGMPSPDRLYLNTPSGFRDAPSFGLDHPLNAGCAHPYDVDGDGREDLLVCSRVTDVGPSPLGVRVLRNVGGRRFADVTTALGLAGLEAPLDAVMADWNGDGRLDIATVAKHRLAVRLRAPAGFGAPVFTRSLLDGQTLASGDVNGDGRPDIYVLQRRLPDGTNAPDLMLVNDGTGRRFTSMPIPEARAGGGDIAYPIDYDRNGLDDFLVLNGVAATPGPIQLIAFFRAQAGRPAPPRP